MTKLNNNVNIYGANLLKGKGKKAPKARRNQRALAYKGKRGPKPAGRRVKQNPVKGRKQRLNPKAKPFVPGQPYVYNPNKGRGRGDNNNRGYNESGTNNYPQATNQQNKLAQAINNSGTQDFTKRRNEVVVARNGQSFRATNYQTPRIHKAARMDPAEVGAVAPDAVAPDGGVLTFNGKKLKAGGLPYSFFTQPIIYMAQGFYAALRKAYIAIGPPSQNDKYAPPMPDPFVGHENVILFLSTVLGCVYDEIRSGRTKLSINIPEHLSFAVNVLATKQLQKTSTGTVDHGELSNNSYEDIHKINFAELDYFLAVMALPANPFKITDNVLTESNVSVYHDQSGKAIHSTMKIEEIASVYGYSILTQAFATEFNSGCMNYDYSGMANPSSTQLFRSSFFSRYNDVKDLVVDQNFNPVLMPNQWVDPGMVMFNYAATGFVPTSEFTYPGDVPLPFTFPDIASLLTKSEGLTYLQKRCANGPPTAIVPDFLAYNCALDLCKALQTKINNFYSQHLLSGVPSIAEKQWDYAVAVAQYVEKLLIPSPIFEEYKAYNDINSWTYVGKPEPRAIYFSGISAFLSILGTGEDQTKNMALNTYFDKVKIAAKYLTEIRYFVKLNFAPEINNYMPNLHLFLQGSDSKIYSVLDPESFKHKDIATWLNISLIPTIRDKRPIALTYIEVKRTANYDEVLANLYQFSFDASYNGQSSELDFYYERLREKNIGFMGALASMLGSVLPMVPSMASTIFSAMNNKSGGKGTIHAANSSGALIQSILSSIVNHFDDKQVAMNAPPGQKVPVKGGAIAAKLLGQAAKTFFL